MQSFFIRLNAYGWKLLTMAGREVGMWELKMDAGHWKLDTGSWMLDDGCWTMDNGTWVRKVWTYTDLLIQVLLK